MDEIDMSAYFENEVVLILIVLLLPLFLSFVLLYVFYLYLMKKIFEAHNEYVLQISILQNLFND